MTTNTTIIDPMIARLDDLEEGDKCPHFGPTCCGRMEFVRDQERSCYCHICAPCSVCTDSKLVCTDCGYEPED